MSLQSNTFTAWIRTIARNRAGGVLRGTHVPCLRPGQRPPARHQAPGGLAFGASLRCLAGAALAAILAGCAAATIKVDLNVPAQAAASDALTVVDERLDPLVRIQGQTFTGAAQVYVIDPQPPIAQALARELGADGRALRGSIAVQRLEVVSKVGFGKADDSTCQIESTFQGKTVRTLARDNTNMTSSVQALARAILDTCLRRHAADLAQASR